MDYILLLASAGFGVVAYGFYFKNTIRSEIAPNRWSWLIWSITTAIESLTYYEVSCDMIKATVFFISAVCCVVVTVFVWTRSKWTTPDWTEVISIAASLGAIGIWFKYQDVVGAHYLAVAALPIAFWPTWRDAWQDFHKENSPAWMIWTGGDLLALTLVLKRLERKEEIPYAVTELICHGLVWVIVAYKCHKALSLQS